MIKHRFRLLIACIVSFMLVLSGCSSDGGGDGSAASSTPTTVSGKVTLSSVVTAKARNKALVAEAARYGKPGSKAYQKAFSKAVSSYKALESRALPSRAAGGSFSNGLVYLYDAGHPEWVYPVAETTTDSEGSYELSTLVNASQNGNAYVDGAAIPSGNYTLLAFTLNDRTNRPELVALQSVVSEFSGVVPGIDLVAQESDAEPLVTTMLGVAKNTDGTQTWGDETLEFAPNAALQVSFSMAMNRRSIDDIGLVIESSDSSTVPSGIWTVSADWLTATYYLDAGQEWGKGVTYTLTVNGADGVDGESAAVFNVFGKSLKLTGVGTFMVPVNAIVDTQKPTATISSPTLAETANAIEITTPIRIASNERMDVNGLLLQATPSLGAQPGVLFVGKNDDDLFEYEFLLGEPLKLDTTYDVVVTGGKDLAGNEMNPLNVSFSTVAATEGVIAIDENSTAEEIATANAQADVKDVFGKWVRAFNDRNLPQLQSVMSGDFFMEYNAADGFDENDINRDGLYDLREFSDMISQAFVFWDYCGVSITGSVAENINIVGDVADFEFTLSAETENNSQDCQEAAPDESLFATLRKINGAWYMVRASEGIDTRGQEIVQANLLELVSPADGTEFQFFDEATQTEVPLTFEWAEITDAAAYAWIIVDSRNARSGFALILPPTMTSLDVPTEIDTLIDAGTIADVSEDFGFSDDFEPRDGAELYWQVAALGKNTVRDVQADRQTDLPKDVTAISELYRFKIAGEYQELSVSVSANGAPVTFSEFIQGYDVVDAAMATITVTTPREGVVEGMVIVDGNTHMEYPVTFSGGVGSVEIQLNQGQNFVNVMDGIPCWVNNTCDAGGDDRDFIEEWFQIVTTGGIAPIVAVDSVTAVNEAGTETVMVNDGWNFYESSDAMSIIVTGSVDCTAIDCNMMNELRLDLWNDKAHARANRNIDFDRTTGAFTVDVEVFSGENWVGIHGHICDNSGMGNCENFNANFGVKTLAGSVYVPPIADVTVSNPTVTDAALAVIAPNENWGDGGRWDATSVTDNVVVIAGTMEFATDSSGEREPHISVGSDGGWTGDRLSVNLDGTFEVNVELFHGWNYVHIQDVNDNWFNLEIYTDAGKEVVRPEIATLDGVAYAGGDYSTALCTITVAGTAMEGDVRAYWNGNMFNNASGEQNYYWEEVMGEAVMNDVTGKAEFTLTLPLIGSTAADVTVDNFIDVFDMNWNWMGVRVINTSDCAYTPPRLAVDGMVAHKDATDTTLVKAETYMWNNDEDGNPIESGARFAVSANDPWAAVVADTVTVSGTSTVPGRTIGAETWVCGQQVKSTPVMSSDTAVNGLYPWTMDVTLYPGFNNINISDGKNWYNAELEADNANVPPAPPVAVELLDGTTVLTPQTGDNPAGATDPCANLNQRYDIGALTTVTVSGTTTGTQNGQGEWHADGAFGRFDIVDGAFSFEVSLYDGFNWIGINDADWAHTGVEIFTTNGVMRPRYVNITNDVDNMPAGDVTISGTVYGKASDGTGQTFVPHNIGGGLSVCDQTGCNWMEFSSDPNAADWGASPITLTATGNANGDYTFSFDVTFEEDPNNPGKAMPDGWLNIWTDGDDGTGNGGWQGHGMDTAINSTCIGCNNGNYWKPGKKASKGMDAHTKAKIKAARSKGH